MTDRYLLDRMILGEIEDEHGDRNVHAWLASVQDRALYVPAIVVYEAAKGFARRRRKELSANEAAQLAEDEADFRAVLDGFADRIAALGRAEALRWGELVGAKEKNVMDRAIAAIAIEGNFVLVTRNRRDFGGIPVRLLDPYARAPVIEGPFERD